MRLLKLAWRQTKRDLAAGEVRLMLMALMLAVLAVTAVGMITDRAETALQQQANRLVGGDAALRADTPITADIVKRAEALGLQQAQTASFPSMVQSGEAVALADIRAIDSQFPLRGEFELQGADGRIRLQQGGPDVGTLWLSSDAARKLQVRIGQNIVVGNLQHADHA